MIHNAHIKFGFEIEAPPVKDETVRKNICDAIKQNESELSNINLKR